MVNWSVPAKNDSKQIHDYIANDSKYYARKVTQEIVAKTGSLAEFPEIGRVVSEISDTNIRELIICHIDLFMRFQQEESKSLPLFTEEEISIRLGKKETINTAYISKYLHSRTSTIF